MSNNTKQFRKENLLFFSYVIILVALFLYSFTQIDLSLTFSRITFLRNLVKSFQYIGYFNRPLSTEIYVFFLVVLLGFYVTFLSLSWKRKLASRFIWKTIIAAVIILVFSYNAFSYDLFNYIFDARIVSHYHQNPYFHKAMEYIGDPMLSFMRWVHRLYPYGPGWLVLTVPLSFLGFGLFLPTFALYKLLMAGSYLGGCFYLYKILKKIKPERAIFGLVFFALNPLVIIESLISAHIDIVMLFFALWSFYLLLEKKYYFSLFLLAISISIKFATGFLLPVYALFFYFQNRKKPVHWKQIGLLAAFFMIATVIVATERTNFQPWYLLLPLGFGALVAEEFYVLIPAIIIPFFALFTYIPYLYEGNWDPPIPTILTQIYYASYILTAVVMLCYILFKKGIKKVS